MMWPNAMSFVCLRLTHTHTQTPLISSIQCQRGSVVAMPCDNTEEQCSCTRGGVRREMAVDDGRIRSEGWWEWGYFGVGV